MVQGKDPTVRLGILNARPMGRWGGRYICQLSNSPKLLLAWLPVPNRSASTVEDELLDEFFLIHGQLPFANLRR